MLDATAWFVAFALWWSPSRDFDDLDVQNLSDLHADADERQQQTQERQKQEQRQRKWFQATADAASRSEHDAPVADSCAGSTSSSASTDEKEPFQNVDDTPSQK